MTNKALGGSDSLDLKGGNVDDALYGDAYEMHQNSVGGNDTLNGESGIIIVSSTAMPP